MANVLVNKLSLLLARSLSRPGFDKFQAIVPLRLVLASCHDRLQVGSALRVRQFLALVRVTVQTNHRLLGQGLATVVPGMVTIKF